MKNSETLIFHENHTFREHWTYNRTGIKKKSHIKLRV